MSVLTTNLKLLYQRPVLWIVYAIMGIGFIPLFLAIFSGEPEQVDNGFLYFSLVGVVFFGIVTSAFFKGIFNKPVSFCFPQSQNTPRNIFSIIAITISFYVAIVYMCCRQPDNFLVGLQIFIAVFFAGISAYTLAVLLTFQSTTQTFGVVFIFLIPASSFHSIPREIISILLAHPWIVMLFGVGVCGLAWFCIGRRSLQRKLCTTYCLTLFDSWNPAKIKKYREQQAARKANPSDERRRDRREGFFLDRMKGYDVLSVGRNCWGWLYHIFGNPGHKIGTGVIVWLFIIGLFAFMPTPSMQWWIFLMPTFIAGMNLPLPLKHSLLLPTSRKTCFRTTLILLPVYTLLILSSIAIIGLFWQGFHLLVPQVAVGEKTFNSAPFQWSYLVMTSFSIPLCFIIRRFIPQEDTAGRMLAIIVLSILIIPFFIIVASGLLGSLETIFTILLILTVLLWPLCVLAYQNYFNHSKLTWPGRA